MLPGTGKQAAIKTNFQNGISHKTKANAGWIAICHKAFRYWGRKMSLGKVSSLTVRKKINHALPEYANRKWTCSMVYCKQAVANVAPIVMAVACWGWGVNKLLANWCFQRYHSSQCRHLRVKLPVADCAIGSWQEKPPKWLKRIAELFGRFLDSFWRVQMCTNAICYFPTLPKY